MGRRVRAGRIHLLHLDGRLHPVRPSVLHDPSGFQRRAELAKRGLHALSCSDTKPDAALGEHRDRVDQMAQRSTQAIQPPHDQRVALAKVLKQPRQLGPLVQRAARGIAEDPPTARGAQRVVLQAELLLARRDPRVPEQRPIARTVSQPFASAQVRR